MPFEEVRKPELSRKELGQNTKTRSSIGNPDSCFYPSTVDINKSTLWNPKVIGQMIEGWLDRFYIHWHKGYGYIVTTREQTMWDFDPLDAQLLTKLDECFALAGGKPCWVTIRFKGKKRDEYIDPTQTYTEPEILLKRETALFEVSCRYGERRIFWRNKNKGGDNKMQELKLARYWNANGFSMGIVAIIEWWDKENQHGQWAAYIGATRETTSEEDTAVFVAEKGRKLSKEDAQHYFPNIQLPYKE